MVARFVVLALAELGAQALQDQVRPARWREQVVAARCEHHGGPLVRRALAGHRLQSQQAAHASATARRSGDAADTMRSMRIT